MAEGPTEEAKAQEAWKEASVESEELSALCAVTPTNSSSTTYL